MKLSYVSHANQVSSFHSDDDVVPLGNSATEKLQAHTVGGVLRCGRTMLRGSSNTCHLDVYGVPFYLKRGAARWLPIALFYNMRENTVQIRREANRNFSKCGSQGLLLTSFPNDALYIAG